MILDREAIRNKPKSATKQIHIPEWDADVFVRRISGMERDELEVEALDKRTMEPSVNTMIGYRAKCAAVFLSDESGNRLFSEPDDWKELRDMDGSAINRIAIEGRKFNGMTVKAIEDLEKNSETGPNDDTGLDSP